MPNGEHPDIIGTNVMMYDAFVFAERNKRYISAEMKDYLAEIWDVPDEHLARRFSANGRLVFANRVHHICRVFTHEEYHEVFGLTGLKRKKRPDDVYTITPKGIAEARSGTAHMAWLNSRDTPRSPDFSPKL